MRGRNYTLEIVILNQRDDDGLNEASENRER